MTSGQRANIIIGAGTLVSRLTGLIRTIFLVGLIGANQSAVADAFNVANQLPNSIFEIISVGILTAVIVPQIVRARRHGDGGNAFISKLYTIAVLVLLGATLLAVIAAPWLVRLLIEPSKITQIALATAFAYWCLPQILFYGLYALIGETLNAARVYGPFTWLPAINNVVSVAGFAALTAAFGSNLTNPASWTPAMIGGLGATTTAGVAAQALLLLLFWRGTGISVRPDFRWRGVGLRGLGRTATWTILMMMTSLTASYIQTWVVSHASGAGPANAVMSNAWLVFMVPYSILVHAIGTTYFTATSERVIDGQSGEIPTDFGTTVRRLGLVLFGPMAALGAAAVPASRVFTNSAGDAGAVAPVLVAYLVGLVPLGVLFVTTRTFYAFGDTRTPFIYNAVQASLVVASALLSLLLMESGMISAIQLAPTAALGQSGATTLQAGIALLLLRRRIGGVRVRSWAPSLLRFMVASLISGLIGGWIYASSGGDDGWMVAEKGLGILGTIFIGFVTIVAYIALLAAAGTPDVAKPFAVAWKRVRNFFHRKGPLGG